MRIVATVEARMSSSRLPGKVLMDVLGKPALERLVERLRRVPALDDLVIATSVNPADAAIETMAKQIGARCYRGSEEDVMDRVVQAARSAEADVIVEVTGDCTLLAPEVIQRAIDLYKTGDYAIVSNTWKLSYPQGADAQVFSLDLLEAASQQTGDLAHREHVSLFFYENPNRYRIHHFEAPDAFKAPELRFQLDYPQDLEFIRAVYQALYPSNPSFSLKEIFALLEQNPELKQINATMQEKMVRT